MSIEVKSTGRARALLIGLLFVAIALNGVPMDAFARELGSNRNAV